VAAIGVSTPRRDSEPKVRGQTRFAADLPIPGLLHARLVPSYEAHALITAISSAAAQATPGAIAVLTAHDLPIRGSGTGRMYEPLAKSEVLYAGQPVALVVAETEAAAEDGAERVEVELEPLTPVLDLEAATRPGAPLAKTTTEETAPDDEAGSDLTDAHASVTAAELGGTAQGLGWALLEELVHDEHGQLSPARSSTTRCRRAGSPPTIETLMVEVPVPEGPFGAKGVRRGAGRGRARGSRERRGGRRRRGQDAPAADDA
jgi:CO/xanthine dehydrogenase Mo-binding subunit